MQIRLMNYSDGPNCYDLWKKAELPVASFDREMYEMKALLEKNPTSCFVVFSDGKFIGTVIGTFNGRRAWVYHLAVDPSFQHKGIGKALLKKTEIALKAQGVTKILLGVSVSNLKTTTFYEHNGYSVMNDAILMEKNYWNQEMSKKGGE